jgi:catechol 2,3-dioxygenase-like lactoylglutathione lyase family enzyme
MAVKNVSGVVALLSVIDMRKSLAWYRDVLGFEVESKWEPEGVLHWAMLRLGGAHLMLNSRFETAEEAASYKPTAPLDDVTLYFSCKDADEAFAIFEPKAARLPNPKPRSTAPDSCSSEIPMATSSAFSTRFHKQRLRRPS